MATSHELALPTTGLPEGVAGFEPAGDRARQIAWRSTALSVLETYHTASGYVGTRLSNEALGSRGWRVQLVPHQYLDDVDAEDWLRPLLGAVVDLGHEHLMATGLDDAGRRDTAVWVVPAVPEAIMLFFNAHQFGPFHMVFPENMSFAIHGNDGDFAAIAGPETFLRRALPADMLGRAATRELQRDIEAEHEAPGGLDDLFAHYAPFGLDE